MVHSALKFQGDNLQSDFCGSHFVLPPGYNAINAHSDSMHSLQVFKLFYSLLC